MKKRITALTVVLLLCLTYCGSVFAAPKAALTVLSDVKSTSQMASIQSYANEYLTVSYVVYKVENGKLIPKAASSAKNTGNTSTVKAVSSVSLASGTYEIHIEGGSNSNPISIIRTYTI